MATRKVGDGLYLFQKRICISENPSTGAPGTTAFLFEVECCRSDQARLSFTADFLGSTNLALIQPDVKQKALKTSSEVTKESEKEPEESGIQEDGSISTTVTVIAEPFSRTLVARLGLVDPSITAALRNAFSWSLLPSPSTDELSSFVKSNVQLIKRRLQKAQSLLPSKGAGINDTDLTSMLLQRCMAQGIRFVDTAFPPGPEPIADCVVWKRPSDYLAEEAHVFGVNGPCSSDVDRGLQIGTASITMAVNNAITCAIQSLGSRPYLLKHIFGVPEAHDLNKNGIAWSPSSGQSGYYAINMCAGGVRQSVIVDDHVPCYAVQKGGPCLTRCISGDLWAPLLEKALIKSVYRSYSQSSTSSKTPGVSLPHEPLIDILGVPFRVINLRKSDSTAHEFNGSDMDEGDTWHMLMRWYAEDFIICASTPPLTDENAIDISLPLGSAYNVVGVVSAGGERLLLLRGEGGEGVTFRGEWTPELRSAVHSVGLSYGDEVEEGAFWISFSDFLAMFHTMSAVMAPKETENVKLDTRQRRNVVSLPSALPKLSGGTVHVCMQKCMGWYEQRRRVTFQPAHTNACTFSFSVYQDIQAYFSLHRPRKNSDNSKTIAINSTASIVILKVVPGDSDYETVSLEVSLERQLQVGVMLSPGRYLAVVPAPSNTDNLHSNSKITSSNVGDIPSEVVLTADGTDFSPSAKQAIKGIHKRLDVDLDGVLNFDELQGFLSASEGVPMDAATLKWIMTNFDSKNDGITSLGLYQIYRFMWEDSGRDIRTLTRDLAYFGHHVSANNQLEVEDIAHGPMILAVHSHTPLSPLMSYPSSDKKAGACAVEAVKQLIARRGHI